MQVTAPRVFVSHSHEDDEFTYRLVHDLITAGADVWVDVAGDVVGIDRGVFLERINEALTSREWFVLVLTPNAIQSRWVNLEVHAAIGLIMQKRMRDMIPVLAHPVGPNDVPAVWNAFHRYDATTDYAAALNGLLRALGLEPHTIHPTLTRLGFVVKCDGSLKYILPPLCTIPDLTPQRCVALTPTTVSEFACYLEAEEGAAPASRDNSLSWAQQRHERADRPVVNVTWADATNYARWLSDRTQQRWRLATQTEWYQAALWNSISASFQAYPWDGPFDASKCNTAEGKRGMATPVGAYPDGASPCGALDMMGNVREWTSNQTEDRRSQEHVVCGGSWRDELLRLGIRPGIVCNAQVANSFTGFRLVRDGVGD